jgi:outer membrane immunogenic protein
MKKILLSAVSLTALTGSALAADLPNHKAPIATPVAAPLWTGFYAGLNAGYGWGTNSNTNSSLTSTGSIGTLVDYGVNIGVFRLSAPFVGSALGNTRQSMTQSGFIGGAQFGYNYQYGQNIVFGFETDIQGTGMRGNSTASGILAGTTAATRYDLGGNTFTGSQTGSAAMAVSAGVDYLGTARGRVGYLFTPNLLVYGTGGLAYGGAWANVSASGLSNSSVSYSDPIANAALGPGAVSSASQTWTGGGRSNALLVGYSAGGGLEWMFMPNWSLKGEALYYNLGNMNVSTTAIAGAAYGQSALVLGPAAAQNFSGPGIISGNTSVNYQGVTARAGINYHFNFSASPVVAKF